MCEIFKVISQGLNLGEGIIADMMIGIECGDKEDTKMGRQDLE